MAKTLISSDRILTPDGIKKAHIIIENDRIHSVNRDESYVHLLNYHGPFDTKIKTKGYVLPGLINTHTHAAMILFDNLYQHIQGIEKSSGDSWLRKIWPLEDYLTQDDIYTGSLKAFTEMAKTGTTCVSDHYFYPKAIARAAKDVGIKLVVTQAILRNGKGTEKDSFKFGKDIETAVQETLEASDGVLVTPTIGAHSIYQLTEDDLIEIAEISYNKNIDVHMHLGEPRDYEVLKERKINKTPVEYARELGLLNERLIAAHSSILTDKDIELYKDAKVRVAWCPFTKARKSQGLTRIPELLENGITVGLGTDGHISSYTYNMLRQASHGITVINSTYGKKPGDMPLQAQDMLDILTKGGAKVVRKDLGSITYGKKADLIIVNGASLDQIIHGSESSDITDVMVEGKFIKRNGKMVTVNEDEIDQEVKCITDRLKNHL
ncbi:MAG: amidohydrolase family protein [archaeon]